MYLLIEKLPRFLEEFDNMESFIMLTQALPLGLKWRTGPLFTGHFARLAIFVLPPYQKGIKNTLLEEEGRKKYKRLPSSRTHFPWLIGI